MDYFLSKMINSTKHEGTRMTMRVFISNLTDKSLLFGEPKDLYNFYKDVYTDCLRNFDKHYELMLIEKNGIIVSRKALPDIRLNFGPLLYEMRSIKPRMTEQPVNYKQNIYVEESKRQEDKRQESEFIDQLSNDSVGHSFGVGIYQKVIQSDNCKCFIVKLDKESIAVLLGTAVILNSGQKIFHIWLCSKRPEYPHINVLKKLREYCYFNNSLFDFDFVTLNVNNDSPLKEIYKQYGFNETLEIHNEFTKKPSMLMSCRDQLKENKTLELSCPAEITQNIETQTKNLFGLFEGMRLYLNYKSTEIFNRLWYY